MVFFIIALFFIIVISSKPEKRNCFNAEYISKDSSNNIKGIFVILVILSHAKGYIDTSGALDKPYILLQYHLNQMIIALFLFYSGYGIMEQIKRRKFAYIMSIQKKRFPNLLLKYDIAVTLFAITWLILGKPVSLKNYLIALTAWHGIGNSSWYIFITFLLYLFTFISFYALKRYNKITTHLLYITLLTILTAFMVFCFRYHTEKEGFWYNTAMIFPLGLWYSEYKDTIEKRLMKNDVFYVSVLLTLSIVYTFTYIFRWDSLIIYIIWSYTFTIIIIMLTMKVQINSPVLKWFGEHVFSVYILQRIPMIVLQQFGLAKNHKYIFIILSIAIACAMAEVFDILTGKLSKTIWKQKKIKA